MSARLRPKLIDALAVLAMIAFLIENEIKKAIEKYFDVVFWQTDMLCCSECEQPISNGYCYHCGYAPSMQDTFIKKR